MQSRSFSAPTDLTVVLAKVYLQMSLWSNCFTSQSHFSRPIYVRGRSQTCHVLEGRLKRKFKLKLPGFKKKNSMMSF